ncbi:MAG: putative transcriptional regulator [Bradyrhizobium sp.]|jgi:hypothetical protein|nr:putative transcriptional regulator [Bradyrhizobium sp.]
MISRPTHSRVIKPAAITGRDSTARYSGGPTAAWRAMAQGRFSAAYRIPLATLKNWEQGRRHPDAPAAAYLLAIKRKPKEIKQAVAH